MKWRDAVLVSLHSFCIRHQTRAVDRQTFINEELPIIAVATGTVGLTPHQTLSRVLQSLRDEGAIQFLGNGSYLLLDSPFDVEYEDLTDEALDLAIKAGQLKLGRVDTSERITVSRCRKGQDRLRILILEEYDNVCAVCDVTDTGLLIASHILRWADAPEQRGELANVMCLCRFHDVLFERGYWSLTDDLQLVKCPPSRSRMIEAVMDGAQRFKKPGLHSPKPDYLRQHRARSGLADQ